MRYGVMKQNLQFEVKDIFQPWFYVMILNDMGVAPKAVLLLWWSIPTYE